MKIKEVTETEMFELLEKNIKGIFYYINHLEIYYCYLITESKKTSNIWNHKEFAFNWMNNVLQTHFTQTNS